MSNLYTRYNPFAGYVATPRLTISTDVPSEPSPWSPSDLPSLSVWLKSDSLSLANDDPVTTWADSSGQGHTAVGIVGNTPVFKTDILNSKPGVYFNVTQGFDITGMGDLMSQDDTFSLFYVMTPLDFNDGPMLFCHPHNAGWSGLIMELTTDHQIQIGVSKPSFRTYQLDLFAAAPRIASLVKTSITDMSYWKDGTITTYTPSGDNDGLGSNQVMTGPVRMGTYFNNTIGLNGYMFEVLYFSDNLLSTDREKVEGYLSHKYGLTSQLPANHPYKTTLP